MEQSGARSLARGAPGDSRGTDRDPRRHRFVRAFGVGFACAFALVYAWSLAVPLVSGPDEPVHVIKSVAIDHGELLGSLSGPQSPFSEVHVPAFYSVDRSVPNCYHRQPAVPASCAPVLSAACPSRASDSTAPACGVAFIYNARYPPAYYAIVGLASFLGPHRYAVYAMRLIAALMAATLLGLAAAATVTWSRSRLSLVGLVAAATPMVIYLGGVVNPSGLEVSAALCLWVTASILVLEHLHAPPPGLVGCVAASAAVFELSRAISPFWLALSVLVLAGVAAPENLRAIAAARCARYAGTFVVVLGVVALAWTLREHALLVFSLTKVPGSTSELTILSTSFAHNAFYIPTMVGVFGDFDTYAPLFTYVVWYGLVACLFVLGVVSAGLRRALVLGALALGVVFLPVVISSSQVHRYGYTWSGRDTLPLAIGLPVIAAAVAARSRVAASRFTVPGVVALACAAQFAAFYEALRRYSVGTNASVFGLLAHPSWSPPPGVVPMLAIELAALGASAVVLVRAAQRAEPAVAPAAHDGPVAPGPGG